MQTKPFSMSKKTTGFDLISNFRWGGGGGGLLHKLSSRELCAEYSTSHIKTQSYLKEQPLYRCEVQEMRRLKYFFEILYTLFFIRTKALVLVKIKNKLRNKVRLAVLQNIRTKCLG